MPVGRRVSTAQLPVLDLGLGVKALPHHGRAGEPRVDGLKMKIYLLGPAELEQLDQLNVRMRDDHPWRGEGTPLAGGPAPEQVKEHVWRRVAAHTRHWAQERTSPGRSSHLGPTRAGFYPESGAGTGYHCQLYTHRQLVGAP